MDDVIPLSVPIVNRRGQEINEIKVAEGTSVFLGADFSFIPVSFPGRSLTCSSSSNPGLLNLNRTEEIWGADAREFM